MSAIRKASRFAVHPAVLTVYAALIAAANLLPAIPMLGVGGSFTVADALVPLSGVFFGPWYGALSAAVGCFVGTLLAPTSAWLGVFTFLTGTIAALCAGLVWQRHGLITAGIQVFGILIHYVLPQGSKSMIFALTMFGSGCVVSLLSGLLHRLKPRLPLWLWQALMIWCSCFAGLTGTAALYQIAHMLLFKLPVVTWKILAVSAPLERACFAAGSVVVGLPLLRSLPKIGVSVGVWKEKPASKS